MRRVVQSTSLFLILTPLLIVTVSGRQTPVPVTVHEWGTFTSIAGHDGKAMEWNAQDVRQDLPCFVERQLFNIKGWMPATLRMETPVLYFYASAETTMRVGVQFRRGAITEWYPHATVTSASATVAGFRKPDFVSVASWDRVRITPNASTTFPTEPGESHYYAARETDATPVEVNGQHDKFLFYRGIASFDAPLAATVMKDHNIAVASTTDEPIGDIILFQNRGGLISFQVRDAATRELVMDAPSQDGETALPLREFEALLVTHGLFAREAQAMVKTWRDSWFEEGTRLFYITSRKFVDSVLPLDITPAPAKLERVFVGRIELLTMATLSDATLAIDRNEIKQLKLYGRFLPTIVNRLQESRSPADKARINNVVAAVYREWAAIPARCN